MQFNSEGMVIKISVSDILLSKDFYSAVLGFIVDDDYTINSNHDFGAESYMQLNLKSNTGNQITIGLYKDIEAPFNPLPQNGTVPSFLVKNIDETLAYLQSKKVVIDTIGGVYIVTNTSDKGYTDKFFFFRDPDNNSLVIRENINC